MLNNKKQSWFGRQPVAVRAALITGAATIIVAVIFGVSSIVGSLIKFHEIPQDTKVKIPHNSQQPTILINPIKHRPVGLLNSGSVERSEQVEISADFFADAVVSQYNNTFFLDIRIVNRSDDPILISAIKLIGRFAEDIKNLQFQSRNANLMAISSVYDIEISRLSTPGAVIVSVLSQVVKQHDTDRFVIRLGMNPLLDSSEESLPNLGINLIFDIELFTSVGTIAIRDLNAVFHNDSIKRIYTSDQYYEELNSLAKRNVIRTKK